MTIRSADADQKMPALFIGHGSPMNAVEDNEFSRAWSMVGAELPKPRAILCVSAHWETNGTWATASDRPAMIYDFQGFPRELYEVQYPAPGSPDLARAVQKIVKKTVVQLDPRRGLDHGTWSVLARLFPQADVPVVQLSLDGTQDPAFHYELGRELKPLRREGVLILGTGNIVHNLGRMVWEDTAFDWAVEFDETVKRLILSGDHAAIVHYERLGRSTGLAVPSADHLLPLFYILGMQEKDEPVGFFTEEVTLGSMSMRSLRVG